jgi:hypothetical protein
MYQEHEVRGPSCSGYQSGFYQVQRLLRFLCQKAVRGERSKSLRGADGHLLFFEVKAVGWDNTTKNVGFWRTSFAKTVGWDIIQVVGFAALTCLAVSRCLAAMAIK